MYEQFKTRAVAVGAEVHRFASRRDAVEFIVTLLEKEGLTDLPGSYAVWADQSLLDKAEQLQLRTVDGISFQVNRALAARSRFGISRMEWAVADTGSLVQDQSAPEQRLASSLPDIHLAVVPTSNIVANKVELFRKINPSTSRYIAFITGPSRTADIERVLTIGVHGPQRLIIVFVDELEGGN
ncbi:MAG TPA: lactate utilization protein [Geomonas sp.]|nr:lactate utilization protein [Geomonas sp.]